MSRLHHVDTRNIKEIVIEGLRQKVEALGELAVPFVFTMDYPSKETFLRLAEGDEVAERRIVVRKASNTVAIPAIGMNAAQDGYYQDDLLDPAPEIYQGWVDEYTIEIAIWTSASDDRDNIVELIKIWMLELEQSPNGEDGAPFFYEHGVQAVTFLSATEDANSDVVQNGVMYVGTLTYGLLATFFNMIEKEELIKYRIELEGRVRECLRIEL